MSGRDTKVEDGLYILVYCGVLWCIVVLSEGRMGCRAGVAAWFEMQERRRRRLLYSAVLTLGVGGTVRPLVCWSRAHGELWLCPQPVSPHSALAPVRQGDCTAPAQRRRGVMKTEVGQIEHCQD